MIHLATKTQKALTITDGKKAMDKMIGFRGKIDEVSKELSKKLGTDISFSKGDTDVVLDDFLVGTATASDESYIDITAYYILDNNKDYYITEFDVAT